MAQLLWCTKDCYLLYSFRRVAPVSRLRSTLEGLPNPSLCALALRVTVSSVNKGILHYLLSESTV